MPEAESTTPLEGISGLLQWLKSHGSEISDQITFKNSPECGNTLGCFAKGDLCKGNLLFAIDLECILSIHQLFASDLFQKMNAIDQNLFPNTLELQLWLFMVHQKHNSNSHFFPYLSSLSSVSPCPFEWPLDLLKALNGTNLESIFSDNAYNSNLYFINEFIRHFPDEFPSNFSALSSLKWAKGHYISRRYPNKYSLGAYILHSTFKREHQLDKIGALVPLLDILNHK